MSPTHPAPAVLVVGHVCLDLVPALDAEPSLRPGHLQLVGPLQVDVGGCVANTGGDLVALGIPTAVGGDLGDDALGALLHERLRQRGLDVSGFRTASGTTSYSIVVQPPHADRTFWHHVGANAAFDGSGVSFGSAELLHLGYPPLLPAIIEDDAAALRALFARARAAGLATSLDLAVVDQPDRRSRARWTRILDGVLPLTDIVSPSLDDLVSAVGGAEDGEPLERAAEAARDLIARGAAIALVSAGAAGSALATASAERFAQAGGPVARLGADWHSAERTLTAPVVRAVRTTGAGDAATAGLLAAILVGEGADRAHRFAGQVAAAKVSGAPLPVIATTAGAR